MIKIWGKLISSGKIIKQATISVDPHTTTFFDMLKNLSQELHIPTPVLLDKHAYDFNVFHLCTFKPDDFVESVLFERFELSLLAEHH